MVRFEKNFKKYFLKHLVQLNMKKLKNSFLFTKHTLDVYFVEVPMPLCLREVQLVDKPMGHGYPYFMIDIIGCSIFNLPLNG